MSSFKLHVVEPCPVLWNAMTGGNGERFCARCALPVHNLSAMTADAARHLIASPSEQICVRFECRPDGTVITRDRLAWIRSAGRTVVLAALAIIFWTTVAIVQRPWQTLARRLASGAPAGPMPTPRSRTPPGDADDAELALAEDGSLVSRMAAIKNGLRSEIRGRRSGHDRDLIRRELAKKRDARK